MPAIVITILQIVLAFSGAFIMALWISMIVWTFRDARSRSRDAFAIMLATLMTVIFGPLGVLLYFLLRPQITLAELYERSLEEKSLLQDLDECNRCPGCSRMVENDWIICPDCHTQLKQVCVNCGKGLHLHWSICPYCATPITEAENAPSHTSTILSKSNSDNVSTLIASPNIKEPPAYLSEIPPYDEILSYLYDDAMDNALLSTYDNDFPPRSITILSKSNSDNISTLIASPNIKEPPAYLSEIPPYDEIPSYLYDDTMDNALLSTYDNDFPPRSIDSNLETIARTFKKYNIGSLWHMTHRNNVKNILSNGILSNTRAFANSNPIDISNHSVQKWRDSREPIYNRKIHDYAPTYINIKNPMLYVKRNIQDELCLIEISLSVLTNDNFVFTDGNAASRSTNFFNLVDDLEQLPWNVLNTSYWSDFADGKRKRCAEVLIYPSIEPRHITKIHCFSQETKDYLQKLNIQSMISKYLFFNKVPKSISDSFANIENDTLEDDIPF